MQGEREALIIAQCFPHAYAGRLCEELASTP
jgi:hypothetical protein